MRLTPRPLTGVVVLVAYLAVFFGVWAVNGIQYRHIGDSAGTLLRWYVAPLTAGAVLLVVAVSVLGWWRPVLFERAVAPRWLVVGPAVMALVALTMLISKDLSATTGGMWTLLIVGSVLVGFCEETATRGVLLVSLRGRFTEPVVWLISTGLFGLMHLSNAFFGLGVAAVGQVGLAFLSGSMLYLLRRVSGSLIWCMALHGLWDLSTFVGRATSPVPGVLPFLNAALALVLVLVLVVRERGLRLGQGWPGAPRRAAAGSRRSTA